MRPLELGTLIFSAVTLGAVVVAVNTKDKGRRALLYNIAAGTGVSAVSTYIFDLADLRREANRDTNPSTPLSLPTSSSMPRPTTSLPAPRLPSPSPPSANPSEPPRTPVPSPSTSPGAPNRIGCTSLSGALPASAVAQARTLLALDPASTDVRYQPSLQSVSTMRSLATDLRGCGSGLGFQPIRDALVKDLEDTATRFEAALGSPSSSP